MKIIGKKADYYDGVTSLGIDHSLIYYRHTKEIKDYKKLPEEITEFISKMPSGFVSDGSTMWGFLPGVICFCGKMYPHYRLWDFYACTTDQLEQQLKKYITDAYYLSEKTVATNILKVFSSELTSEDEATLAKNYHRRYGYYWYGKNITAAKVDLFHKDNSCKRIHVGIFSELEVPVFAVFKNNGKYDVVTNPNLKELGFPVIVDPYTAWQELSMFLGGVLNNPEKEVVQITDDKILLLSKGFDTDSFKALAPGQKKLKRRQNKERKRKSKQKQPED